MTRERPILFSPAMVRAILAGTKTQTRRIVKPTQSTPKLAPLHMEPYLIELSDGTFEQERDDHGLPCWIGTHPEYPSEYGKWFSCPHGQPGDRLWVRETYAVYGEFTDETGYCYKADGDKAGITWKSPLFMPRTASRILLELVSVRVERVQEISHEDALAEGVEDRDCASYGFPVTSYAVANYHNLWDSLNAKRGYGWASNPFVWVLEFRRVAP